MSKGLILVNLGTPNKLTKESISDFLWNFLSDRNVVDIPSLVWKPILKFIVIPLRLSELKKKYSKIWTDEGSPLLSNSYRIKNKLEEISDLNVEIAMSYSSPSIDNAINSLLNKGVNNIIVLPMYPQYSTTTTKSVYDQLVKSLNKLNVIPSIKFISSYYNNELYISSLANKIKNKWSKRINDVLVCSYHGIPEDYNKKDKETYLNHCLSTTNLIKEKLNIKDGKIITSFQSRFGYQKWLAPYTEDIIIDLAKKNKSIDIIAPSFSVDCIETLEEISIDYKELYNKHGGSNFDYIECLNDSTEQIDIIMKVISE